MDKIQFIEKEYLEMNPDVHQAVIDGVLKSGYDHYIGYGKAEGRKGMRTFDFNSIGSFPEHFNQRITIKYPPDMDQPFEEWYFDNYDPEKDKTDRIYLPVFWTGYLVKADFGHDQPKVDLLQDFIDSLDRSKKYYTILNFDDGCLVDFKDLDIIIFTGSGKGGNSKNAINIPIPLITTPHKYNTSNQKDIICSFVGRNSNHPIRERIYDLFKDDKTFYFAENVSLDRFCEITSRSMFVLCPRGYGLNSFRIMESLQYKAVPIYISDWFVTPFGVEDYFIKVYDYEVSRLRQIIDHRMESIKKYIDAGSKFYSEYCLYPALKEKIRIKLN
jgi:hypothetical protein